MISAWKHFRTEFGVSIRKLDEQMADVVYFAKKHCNGNIFKANLILLNDPQLLRETRLRRTGHDRN